MRVRSYGLVLLGLVGIVPLAVYGGLAIRRSERTSVEQVRRGNQNLAETIAVSVREHIDNRRRSLATLGVSVVESNNPRRVLDTFELTAGYRDVRDVVIYGSQGRLEPVVGHAPEGLEALYLRRADELRERKVAPIHIEQSTRHSLGQPRFAHVATIAERIEVAGEFKGIIVARYDLVGVWATIAAVRVGGTGFVRLIASTGDTIAHGQPDERRTVFSKENLALLDAAASGAIAENYRGEEIVVSSAPVPGLNWQDPNYRWLVLVEQTVEEAFAATQAMMRDLAIVGAGLLLIALVVGIVVGRGLVRALEGLRSHARRLPVDLGQRLESRSRLTEVKDLADAIDRMAADLIRERDEARRRERLTTFARVAAGLAHDLRLPIEAVRGACEMVNTKPRDDHAREILRKVSQRDLPRLKRFVDDLQRLARRGRLDLDVRPTDPLELVEDIRAGLAGTPKWSGVKFEARGGAAPIRVDPDLVRRAVVNLASNAADACLEKGRGNQVTLEVADSDDGDAVEFRITDSGIGIPRERLATLEKEDFLSTKRSTGVGLGLGVVRQVAATHSGRLLIESEAGVGSTFTLKLPREGDSHYEI